MRETSSSNVRKHIPALDGVRGLAAAMVMFFHFGRQEIAGDGPKLLGSFAQYGWTGVDLFFVLSGFLISGILLDSRDRPKFFSTFYKRRSLRIFPLYFAFLALYLYVIMPLLPGNPGDVLQRQKWLWTYLSNFDVARFGWYPGVGSHANNMWSLAIEEQFYLVFPLAVYFLPRRLLWFTAAGCVVGAFAARQLVHLLGYEPRVAYVLTFTRVDALGLGILVSLAARQGNWLRRLIPVARALIALAILACVWATRHNGRFSFDDWSTLLIAQPLLAFGFASVLLLTVAEDGSNLLRKLFESRTLRFLGAYSYGLYMWHPLMGRLAGMAGLSPSALSRTLESPTAAAIVVISTKFALAIVTAVISYRVIERPFLRIKDRMRV